MNAPAITPESPGALVARKALKDGTGGLDAGATVWSPPSPEFLARVSHDFARRHLILSEGCADGVEQLVAAETTRSVPVFNVCFGIMC